MSFVALLLTFLIALVLSNFVDGLTASLGTWPHLPRWVFWALVLGVIAWCMEE